MRPGIEGTFVQKIKISGFLWLNKAEFMYQ